MTRHPLAAALVAITLLAITHAPARGAEIPEGWGQVEVIIFAQSDLFGAEGMAIEPRLDYPTRARRLAGDEVSSVDQRPDAPVNVRLAALMIPDRLLSHETAIKPASFTPLDRANRSLNPDAYTLDRSGAYRVLFHQAWLQPLTGRSATDWVIVEGGRSLGNHFEIGGALRVYQSRALHIETDIWHGDLESAQWSGDSPADSAETTRTRIVLPEPPPRRGPSAPVVAG